MEDEIRLPQAEQATAFARLSFRRTDCTSRFEIQSQRIQQPLSSDGF